MCLLPKETPWGLQEHFKNVNAPYNPVGEKRLTSSQHPPVGTLPGKAGEDSNVPVIFLQHGRTSKYKRPFSYSSNSSVTPCHSSALPTNAVGAPSVPGFAVVPLGRHLLKTCCMPVTVHEKQDRKDTSLSS